jgi:hypothetical protein
MFSFSRRNRAKKPNHPRRLLEVEQLERRELLSGTTAGLPLFDHLSPDKNVSAFSHSPGADNKPGSGGGGGGGGGGGLTVSNVQQVTTTAPEAEEDIAVGPNAATSNVLVSAISDFSMRGGYNTTKYAYSTNGGSTWTEAFLPTQNSSDPNSLLVTTDGKTWIANSDPVVAVNSAGTAYSANLYLNADSQGHITSNGVYVTVLSPLNPANLPTTSTPQTYVVASSPDNSLQYDKDWMTVDNSSSANSGRVYVSYTLFSGNSDTIYLTTPTNMSDLSKAWTTPFQINPSSQNGAVQGSQIAVAPDGTIYMAYEVFYVGGLRQIFVASLTYNNGSFSFVQNPTAVTPLFSELNFPSSYRTDSFPSLAIGPNPNSPGNYVVYVSYADQERRRGAEVKLVLSTNDGTSWSSPVTVNSVATGQQFFPAISVAPDGTAFVSWFDTQNTPSNNYYNVYASKVTLASNGTPTIGSETKLDPVSSYFAGPNSFIGDYAGITAGVDATGAFADAVWTSGGFNNGNLWTAKVR